MKKKNILLRSKIKKAQALARADQLAEARVVLEQIIKTERRDADVWLMLGIINGKQDQHTQAVDCFRKALELRSGDIQILYNFGIALRGSGNV
ncbi:MAG: tetratricopeptide repeat protein, partial [Deltaproteobacteria bacterium]|nr:tetratricopeptide repeat protein [Deltaproteobacteria bacterium]